MDFNEYQKLAQRTSADKDPVDKIHNGCLGLCGEAGECIDILKKYMHQGHPLDKDKLIDEISDVLWYVAELSTGLGVPMGDIAQHNIEKLQSRYPDGFDVIRSIWRDIE